MSVDDFVEISVRLTGFDATELRASGMVDRYYATLSDQVGGGRFRRFLAILTQSDPNTLRDELSREIARAVTHLWYLGVWPGLPDWAHAALGHPTTNIAFTVSVQAYAEGLVWKAFQGFPPGTRATGFGSWARPPRVRSASR